MSTPGLSSMPTTPDGAETPDSSQDRREAEIVDRHLPDGYAATSDALNAYQNTWLAIHQLSAATATDLTP